MKDACLDWISSLPGFFFPPRREVGVADHSACACSVLPIAKLPAVGGTEGFHAVCGIAKFSRWAAHRLPSTCHDDPAWFVT